ncbi:MAG: hypothetical protein J1E42_03365 [Akkermansiaceae bacterium]|nr:hypothetical protein [Akkermansiaceae bacterium]
MNLRDKLRRILPDILPRREQDAIKGRELISRVREVLGNTYSDGSLRTQFSLLALEADTCLARIPNGQGYYLRRAGDPLPSLQEVFDEGPDTPADSPLHRAIALAVRLYDTAGLSVFAYPPEEESWGHPDLVVVQWPAGQWGEDGAYTMRPGKGRHATYRAVCVGVADSPEVSRQAFYRALACGQWAQESELLLIGPAGEAEEELTRLASLYGVGVRCLADPDQLAQLPETERLFRAELSAARDLLAELPQVVLAPPRHQDHPAFSPEDMPDVLPVQEWARQCVARGRVESYERRVAVH